MAHHVQFGATPHRTTSTTSHPSPAQDFKYIVLQKQMKTMSDFDKEEEARIAKSHREKAKKLGYGLRAWLVRRVGEKDSEGK